MIYLLKSPQLFPVIMIALNGLAAIRYGLARQPGQTLYWSAAFAINIAVTFMIGRR